MVTGISCKDNRGSKPRRGQDGALITEILIALVILLAAILPLGMSFLNDHVRVRRLYNRAVAMELIDGEMEVLAAGEWHSFKVGAQTYPLAADAAKNLPPGVATLTIHDRHLKLEWKPENGARSPAILREAEGK